ncbi:MAG: flagellar filament capping protein FliD [bacterium]
MSLSIPPTGTAPITFNGLASGLNTSQIITAMLAPETAVINSYTAQEGTLTAQQTAWQGIQTDLTTLLTQTQSLQGSQAFQVMTASSTASGITATAQPGAPAGSYSLNVTALAQAQQSDSAATVSDPTATTFGTGTITITVGSQTPVNITIASGQNSLNGIAAAINNAGAGVTASVINNGSGSKLLLSANATGTANGFTVTDGLSGGTTALGPFTAIQAAQNASLTLGSGSGAITVTSSSNTVSSLVPGVTLTLSGVGAGTVTVSTNVSALQSLVQSWVNAYNQVQKDVNAQSSYNTTTQQPGGPLFGSQLLDVIEHTMASNVDATVAGAPANLNSLPLAGITMNSDGTLSVNTSTLQSQLTASPSNVGALMQGLANSLQPALASLATPVTGAVATQLTGIGNQLTSLQDTVTALQQQLAQEQTILQQQFAAMEQAVSQNQSAGTLLNQLALAAYGSPSTSGSSSTSGTGSGG